MATLTAPGEGLAMYRYGNLVLHVNRGNANKQPKTADLVIEPLSREEIDRIMGTINPRTALGVRNTVLVTIMLDTGLRISEVAGLKDRDVHIEGQYLKAMGKGSKERVVSFGTACRKALFQYRQRYRGEPAHPGVDTFFLSIDWYPERPTPSNPSSNGWPSRPE